MFAFGIFQDGDGSTDCLKTFESGKSEETQREDVGRGLASRDVDVAQSKM